MYLLTPPATPATTRPIYYDIHGGALIAGGGDVCGMMGTNRRARSLTWSVDYRMPPDFPYPTPLDDCLAVYRGLLEITRPEQIAVGGGSAGGNLAAALTPRACAEGLPMPGMPPPHDTRTRSHRIGRQLRHEPRASTSCSCSRLTAFDRGQRANGHDLHYPFLSPLFGDVSKSFLSTVAAKQAPAEPVPLQRGAHASGLASRANVYVELHVWEAMPHGGFHGAPEDADIGVEVRKFLSKHL